MHKNKEIKQHMTGADAVLIGVCLLAAAAFAVWFALGGRDGRTLRISYDGKVVETLELDGPALQESAPVYYLMGYEENGMKLERFETYPEIPEGISYNLLFVSGSGVSMEAADCRDQICVRHIPITKGGENIICLPHRLAVEIVGGTDGETPDGMVK